MKKTLLTVALISLFATTGCGKKDEVVCTGKVEESGMSYEMKVVGKLKDDKITSGSIEMTFSDEKAAQTFCGFFALANSMAENSDEQINYTCDGKKVKVDSIEAVIDDNFEGMTKDDFIKEITKEENVSCK